MRSCDHGNVWNVYLLAAIDVFLLPGIVSMGMFFSYRCIARAVSPAGLEACDESRQTMASAIM